MVLEDIEYLFDGKLIESIENLIEQTDKELVLISPYLDLSPQIRHKLNIHLTKNKTDFKLKVLFGKDGLNKLKSGKDYGDKLKKSLQFLMKFPNVDIRFEDRLHAKYYKNDFDVIYSSMNLIDYSERKNIEFGIKVKLESKAAISRMLHSVNDAVNDKIDDIKRKIITGGNTEVNPIEKFNSYFNEAKIVFQSSANLIEKNNVGAKVASLVGITLNEINTSNPQNIKIDELSEIFNGNEKAPRKNVERQKNTTDKISLNNFIKEKGIDKIVFIEKLKKQGLVISEKEITDKGIAAGLELKKYMGNDYIAIPKELELD